MLTSYPTASSPASGARCSVSELGPENRFTRFILSSSHFAHSAGHVRKRAFEPAKADNATSVFATTSLLENEVWSLGTEHVGTPRGEPILARGDILETHVRACGLRVVRAEPPPRHANIVGWPGEKHEVMALCEQLAEKATLVLSE